MQCLDISLQYMNGLLWGGGGDTLLGLEKGGDILLKLAKGGRQPPGIGKGGGAKPSWHWQRRGVQISLFNNKNKNKMETN
jgi:hypothetical protein